MSKVVNQERFINEALAAHNSYRVQHGVSELEHEPRLSSLAQEWAEKLASDSSLKYRSFTYKSGDVGENIMKFNLKEAQLYYRSGNDVTNEWYSEENDYDYKGKFSANTGHFTQLVWKNTQRVGFGFAIDETGMFYAVANYFPAGNYKKKFLENVLPLTKTVSNRALPVPNFSSRSMPSENPTTKAAEMKDLISKIANHKTNSVDESIEPEEFDESIEESNYNFEEVQSRFINEALATHNKCRKAHGLSALLHNPELSMIAQTYSEKLARMNKMVHSTNKWNEEKIGENLAYAYDSRLNFYSGEKASMQWYDEIYDHNFDLDHQRGTGHFTQLIWKKTEQVGFGVAEAKNGSFYATANYYPAGNFIGRFKANVPRALSKPYIVK